MKAAIPSSSYDSASSRAQAPQAGAALKSSRIGRPDRFASVRADSMSLDHWTGMHRFYNAAPSSISRPRLRSVPDGEFDGGVAQAGVDEHVDDMAGLAGGAEFGERVAAAAIGDSQRGIDAGVVGEDLG